MYGKGIIKGLGVTLKHVIDTYIDDITKKSYRNSTPEGIQYRISKDVKGTFTVQYPEEKLPIPEEFRFVPFLVYETKDNGERFVRCTSCGICSKVCPPQCIWIEQTMHPKTGRPVPEPAEFYIDIDICMNCGYCAEYCPFDAIKMDHAFEIASYDRKSAHIFNKEHLLKPVEYYADIRPLNYQREEAVHHEKESRKSAHDAEQAQAA